MTEVLTRYPAGADIPEWLFAVEPMGPQSSKGRFFFTIDVDLVETPDYFVVLPTRLGGHIESLFTFEGEHCALFAGGKPVLWTIQLISMSPKGWAPVVPLPATPRPATPRPGLLARLWAAFKG